LLSFPPCFAEHVGHCGCNRCKSKRLEN